MHVRTEADIVSNTVAKLSNLEQANWRNYSEYYLVESIPTSLHSSIRMWREGWKVASPSRLDTFWQLEKLHLHQILGLLFELDPRMMSHFLTSSGCSLLDQ